LVDRAAKIATAAEVILPVQRQVHQLVRTRRLDAPDHGERRRFEDLQDIGVVLDLGAAVHQAGFRCCIHPQMSSVDCFIAWRKL
jgi:hypothetical protein